MFRIAAGLGCAVLLACAPTARGRTWVILPDGSGDAPTIQAGIHAASVGDTVLVACGTFHEHDIMLRSGLTVRGESVSGCATIDAGGLGPVLRAEGVDATTRVEGLELTGGAALDGGGLHGQSTALLLADCLFRGNHAADEVDWVRGAGGGVYFRDSAPTLLRCRFEENTATFRGGGAAFESSSPRLTACVFSANQSGHPATSGQGGGLYVSGGATTMLLACDFVGNRNGAAGGGAAIYGTTCSIAGSRFLSNSVQDYDYFGYGDGGGLAMASCQGTLEDCDFANNGIWGNGAGLLASSCTLQITDCSFRQNAADGPWGPTGGGAAISGGSTTLLRSRFYGNHATRSGGGLLVSGVDLSMAECIFSLNHAGGGSEWELGGGGAIAASGTPLTDILRCTFVDNGVGGSSGESLGHTVYATGGSPVSFHACIVFFPFSGPAFHTEVPPQFTCCDLYGHFTLRSGDNFSLDPLFCDADAYGFELMSSSPCLPENNACHEIIGALGAGCGPIAVERMTWGKVKAAYRE